MPTPPRQSCPSCRSPTTVMLENMSRYAQVNYFRCLECMHVWNLPKAGPGLAPPVAVKAKAEDADG
ncbi:MAG TPA: hypothetical protein VFO19_08610 [Vicinamibacterales bacterium]|nr:hypothetical protein [Vicinamibacterales bacterium]